MKIEKPKNRVRRYFARGEDSLRNGSFLRASRYGVSLFMNGDYMGMIVDAERGKPLEISDEAMDGRIEFDYKAAEKLIPGVAR